MIKMTGTPSRTTASIAQCKVAPENNQEELLRVAGMVHGMQDMGKFTFLTLRMRDGMLQCVLDNALLSAQRLRNECAVLILGVKVLDERARHGFEVHVRELSVLGTPSEELPVNIAKRTINMSVENELAHRPATLRNASRRAAFRLQAGLAAGFRDFLGSNGFTEIFSPKIVATGAEGGSNIFKLDYFGKEAFLAQSPQFYKQTMIPVYERVFEIAPVFRAEKHDTARHLNEYVSVDLEMGFINSFYDIMQMETAMLRHAFDYLRTHYADTLAALNLTLPQVGEIPAVPFTKAKEMVAEHYGRRIKDPYDLEPQEERLIGELFAEKEGSDFVFVTHYPSKKRPFYAMDDPENPKYTLSFDLLYKGMEVTTGGQRIHDYAAQVEKMQAKGLNPADFESYLMLHKYGCPPHGGLGLGLERLCMKLMDEANIRSTSLFPRDTHRLTP